MTPQITPRDGPTKVSQVLHLCPSDFPTCLRLRPRDGSNSKPPVLPPLGQVMEDSRDPYLLPHGELELTPAQGRGASPFKASEGFGWGKAWPSGQCLLLIFAPEVCCTCSRRKQLRQCWKALLGKHSPWPPGLLASCPPARHPVLERIARKEWSDTGQQSDISRVPGSWASPAKDLPRLFCKLTQSP